MPRTPIPVVRSAPVDQLGGATLTTQEGKALLSDPAIRHLDIRDCPHLRRVDLSDCQPGLHVTIDNAPTLRVLRVAPSGPGAVVHLASHAKTPVLIISGSVDEFDACWPSGSVRIASRGRPSWQGVGLNRDNGVQPVEALVTTGDTGLEDALRYNDDLRDVIAFGAGLPGDVDTSHLDRLHSLTLHGCSGAIRLKVPNDLHALELRDHGGLERIDGAGEVLRLYGCQAQRLTVSGHWAHVLADGGRLMDIEARLVNSIDLRNRPRVHNLYLHGGTRLGIRGGSLPILHTGADTSRTSRNGGRLLFAHGSDSVIRELLSRMAQGDADAWEQLCALATKPAKSLERLHRLRALSGAIGEVEPAALWRLRCLMHATAKRRRRAVHQDDALREAGERWQWRFPQDLAREGWDADVQLAEVAQHTPEAAPFFTLLPTVHHELQLAALADAVFRARRRGHSAPEAFTDALERGIRQACQHLPRRRRGVDATTVLGLVRGAVLIADADGGERLRRFANAELDVPGRIRVLTVLAEHGCATARSDLWLLATGTTTSADRQQAQRGALASVRSSALAQTTEEAHQ